VVRDAGCMELKIQSSEPITCEEGKNVGLIDAIVSPEELLEVSRLWALDIAEGRRPRINTLQISDKLGSLPEACDTLNTARQRVMKIASNMSQQRAWLDVIEEGIVSGCYSGILKVSFI
jgi:enoyl-CoA hydratase/3-hydroxyacyl-CoA dehydrogenase